MIKRNSDLDKVINAIVSAKQLTSEGKKVTVYITSKNQLKSFELDELIDIFKKIERDEKIFKITQSPSIMFGSDSNLLGTPCFVITLKDNFDDWVTDYQRTPSYKEELQKPEDHQSTKPPVIEPELIFKITYTTGREIVLNDYFLIGKPDFGGENDIVFDYLFKNPNKKFTKNAIETAIRCPLQKTFHKIVENLGFKGDLKKVFFNISKDYIQFNNPVTKKETGLDYIKLS